MGFLPDDNVTTGKVAQVLTELTQVDLLVGLITDKQVSTVSADDCAGFRRCVEISFCV